MRIHLDTDLGSNPDDLCALAMVLGWPEAELTGVTTTSDPGGLRAGFVRHAMGLAARREVPVVAGADGSLGGYVLSPVSIPDHWPEPIPPRPGRPGEAIDLLAASAEIGATIVALGPYTNLAMVEAARPGLLAAAGVVVMGGHVPPTPEGFPRWGTKEDFNVQQDALAAKVVLGRCRPTVVGLAPSLRVGLRHEHVEPLRRSGPLGRLMADQAEAHARDNARLELVEAHPAFGQGLLNFQQGPLACAVALGWDGVTIAELAIGFELREDGLLHMKPDETAPQLPVVTDVDGPRFERAWLEAVLRASSGS
jgi:purine nucleosidase